MRTPIYQIAIILFGLLLAFSQAFAQEKDSTIYKSDNVKIIITQDGDTIKKRKGLEGLQISIGTNGVNISDPKKKKVHKKLHTGMHFDFGFNNVVDNTNYRNLQNSKRNLVINDTGALRMLTKDDLNLNNGRSINFNFWPVWLKQDIAKHKVQIETGLGFQFFNYRFDTKVVHANYAVDPFWNMVDYAGTYPKGFEEISNAEQLQGKEKNKLGVSYLSIPLMIRFNSNKKNGHRYFVGGGVIGSYKLKSWTKFYGEKNSGDFGLNDWMTQVTAEIGVTGVIKLYGTYALQSMYNYGLDRSPFAIGIRL